MKTHNDEKPFKCLQFVKAFKQRPLLKKLFPDPAELRLKRCKNVLRFERESSSLLAKNKEYLSMLNTLPIGLTPQQSQHLKY